MSWLTLLKSGSLNDFRLRVLLSFILISVSSGCSYCLRIMTHRVFLNADRSIPNNSTQIHVHFSELISFENAT